MEYLMERYHGSITINGNITINPGNIDITITYIIGYQMGKYDISLCNGIYGDLMGYQWDVNGCSKNINMLDTLWLFKIAMEIHHF